MALYLGRHATGCAIDSRRLEKIHAVEESVERSGRERRRFEKLMVLHGLQKCEMLIVGKQSDVDTLAMLILVCFINGRTRGSIIC